jgi:hypothetical protein
MGSQRPHLANQEIIDKGYISTVILIRIGVEVEVLEFLDQGVQSVILRH